MNKIEGIQVGDVVDVFFNNNQPIYNAEVLYTPCATGDCFTLKSEYGIHNVQQYDNMFKKCVKK